MIYQFKKCFQVAAYLMMRKGMSSAEALETIRQSRPIRPNPGFLQQLADHENLLSKKLVWSWIWCHESATVLANTYIGPSHLILWLGWCNKTSICFLTDVALMLMKYEHIILAEVTKSSKRSSNKKHKSLILSCPFADVQKSWNIVMDSCVSKILGSFGGHLEKLSCM